MHAAIKVTNNKDKFDSLNPEQLEKELEFSSEFKQNSFSVPVHVKIVCPFSHANPLIKGLKSVVGDQLGYDISSQTVDFKSTTFIVNFSNYVVSRKLYDSKISVVSNNAESHEYLNNIIREIDTRSNTYVVYEKAFSLFSDCKQLRESHNYNCQRSNFWCNERQHIPVLVLDINRISKKMPGDALIHRYDLTSFMKSLFSFLSDDDKSVISTKVSYAFPICPKFFLTEIHKKEIQQWETSPDLENQ